jgi:hypothetical protein
MRAKATAVVGAAIVLAGCGGSTQTAPPSTIEIARTVTVTVTAPAPPFAPRTIIETDGTFRVGIDIVPGTYRSAGPSPEGDSDCYWARLSSLRTTDILDSGLSTGALVVMITPNDKAFATHGCLPWQRTD